jgi:hypothetical protein
MQSSLFPAYRKEPIMVFIISRIIKMIRSRQAERR